MTTEQTGSGDLARSLDLLWGTKEQPSRGPKPGLTLERIVSTAVALANSEGLTALSMRKVAAELGVGTMSLYRYVPGKGELLDLMLDHVNAPGEDADRLSGKGWRTSMEQLALDSWELYTGNPWLLQVNQVRPVLGPNSMAGFDLALASLHGIGLTGREKVGLLVAIDNYVVGAARAHVLHQQAAQQSGLSDEEFWATQEPYMIKAMETGVYPEIATLPDDTFTMTAYEAMRFGLEPLLDGFQAFIDRRGGEEEAADEGTGAAGR
ncbi:TetR/AcrR family transcriptional regulator [Streptomyces daliensis]|uniref:TetR/AcrR family transcriptional regulator n=1 Tax=Streptomyces daliensis TaxID=299421 RepID=A0A8T4IYD4_9ACTN|nr:TetR/AcrR family transcriptional regulator [Streptomyces daliensis]